MGRYNGAEAEAGEEAAEEARRVDGTVLEEEVRVGDDAPEGEAGGGYPRDVDGGGETEEDVLQEMDVEERCLPLRWRDDFEAMCWRGTVTGELAS